MLEYYSNMILSYKGSNTLSVSSDNVQTAFEEIDSMLKKIKRIKATYFYKEKNYNKNHIASVNSTYLLLNGLVLSGIVLIVYKTSSVFESFSWTYILLGCVYFVSVYFYNLFHEGKGRSCRHGLRLQRPNKNPWGSALQQTYNAQQCLP